MYRYFADFFFLEPHQPLCAQHFSERRKDLMQKNEFEATKVASLTRFWHIFPLEAYVSEFTIFLL